MIQKIKSIITKLLKKAQKITGTDNIYIVKYGSYLTMGNIISMIAAFLLSFAFSRLLSKEVYGEYRYILSMVAILGISSLQGLNNALVRGVARGFENTVRTAFKVKIKWSLLGSLGSIGIATYFWIQGNAEFTISFLIIAAFLPLFKSGEIHQNYLDGKKLFGKRITYTTLIQILSTVAIVVALFLTKRLFILILVYFLFYSFLRIFFLFWTIKKYPPNKKNDPETIAYGKYLSLIQIASLVAQQVDKILLFHLVGPIQLAIYSFADLPIQFIRDPLQNIQELVLPKLSVKSKEEIKKTLPKKLIKSIIFILPIIALYIIIAPYFYKIIFPQYTESIFYSQLLAFTLLIFPISIIRLSFLSQMMTKTLSKINIISPVLGITFMIILGSLYGILGIIIAQLLTQLIISFVVCFFFKKM